jgi:hypothetical protein
MRYFLDMNLPIYYCMQLGHSLEKKTKKFIINKSNNLFLLCDYIKSINLPRWLDRQKVILFEFNQKIQDETYPFFSSKKSDILFPKDKLFANKLFLNYKKANNKKQFIQNVNNIFTLLDRRVKNFIQNYIDDVVIPESEIDFNLKSCLFTFIGMGQKQKNDSDARTIASAVQEHNNKELHIITADKKDWTPELLEEVHNDIFLKKKYPKLPKIDYLQDYE